MKPSLGRVIIVRGKIVTSNGSDLAPAVVTRIWSDEDTRNEPVMVNCTAQPDLAGHQHIGSVFVYDTKEEADVVHDAQVPPGSTPVAYWPPRV